MYELGSGDWIGLGEAAKMICEGRPITKTAEDVVKAGYLDYEGIRKRLRIYTFARQPIHAVPYEAEWEPESSRLYGDAKLASFRCYGPGDIFELHPGILEKLLMLRNMPSSAALHQTIIRCEALRPIDGWQHHPEEGDEQEYWSAVFDGVIRPEIEIRWEDLRVDREELRELIEELRRAAGVEVSFGAANDESSAIVKPAVKIKRERLIDKYEREWPTIRSDLDNRSRPGRMADPHGLHTAVVPGKEKGIFFEEKVLEWGRNNGRIIKRELPSKSIHDSPVSVRRDGWPR